MKIRFLFLPLNCISEISHVALNLMTVFVNGKKSELQRELA